MKQGIVPDQGASITSMVQPSQVSTASNLAAENQMLKQKLEYVLQQSEVNHQIMRRHQAFDLEIVGATTFTALIRSIFDKLPQISNLDIVTLTLLDQGDDIRHVIGNLGVDFVQFPNLLFVENEADLRPGPLMFVRPMLGTFKEIYHRRMFPHTVRKPNSVAIIPLLRNKKLIGSLNLGSLDESRFVPELSTDFLEHLASIIAICLENVISNELLKYIGLTDPLTGVYNRRYIDHRLLEEIGRAHRQDYKISCMYIDIDHFKQINDTVGHQGGDEVLREVATRIKAELRLSDAMGRYGGEEFVALLINADLHDAAVVAERIRSSIEQTTVALSTGQNLKVTVSLGVSTLTKIDRAQPMDVIAQKFIASADRALYQAKESGRNRVVTA